METNLRYNSLLKLSLVLSLNYMKEYVDNNHLYYCTYSEDRFRGFTKDLYLEIISTSRKEQWTVHSAVCYRKLLVRNIPF